MVVDVREMGAKGDGHTDDTAAIQRAVDRVAGTGGTVLVPAGTYLINTVAHQWAGISLKSNMTLQLSPSSILKAIPNASENYAILMIDSASNVNVVGGILEGDRAKHQKASGEWGMGLSIHNSHQVAVEETEAKDCWGDGFYISGKSTNIILCRVVSDHNRRQGLSVVEVSGLIVRDSVFKNTTGTLPEAGIDLEPNDGCTVKNVLVTGCRLLKNAGGGFQCGFNSQFTTPRILDAVLDGNIISGNGQNPSGGGYRASVLVSHCLGNASILNNRITENTGQGITVTDHSANTVVKGNIITGTIMFNGNDTWTGGGIYVSMSPHTLVTENIVKDNPGKGIWQVDDDLTVQIHNNTLLNNGK